MYSNGPLHMAEQKQGDQLEPTYSSSMWVRGVAQRIYRKRKTIGKGDERGSGISVLMTQDDDDDNLGWSYPQMLMCRHINLQTNHSPTNLNEL